LTIARLAREDAATAELVKLRLFAGLTMDDAALALGTTHTTGFRQWTYARAFLRAEMRAGPSRGKQNEKSGPPWNRFLRHDQRASPVQAQPPDALKPSGRLAHVVPQSIGEIYLKVVDELS
jgi:hypothetical protein